MKYNDKLLIELKKKYTINQIIINDNNYSLYSIGKEKNNNYIILKNEYSTDKELNKVTNFIDKLYKNKSPRSSFIFITFVKNNFKDDEYMLFNGVSFLHTISYNLITKEYTYDKKFYYLGSNKIKKIFKDIEQIIF